MLPAGVATLASAKPAIAIIHGQIWVETGGCEDINLPPIHEFPNQGLQGHALCV